MEMTEPKNMDGHVFKPSLQDISLKRFRLRYCTFSNCYYLHWDNTVCPQLSRIDGLENGAFSITSIQRVIEDNNLAYLTYEENGKEKEDMDDKKKSLVDDDDDDVFVTPSSISWRLDFSDSGLAIKSVVIKARQPTYSIDDDVDDEDHVTFTIEGDCDSGIKTDITLGDYLKEIPLLRGSKSLTLTANLQPPRNSTAPIPFLTGYSDYDDCPLDIIVNLMCSHSDGWPFAGEILLGLKYNTTGASESLREKSNITVDCGIMGGQLQVHLVEGAGFVKEGSKKALNSFVQCGLLPDPNKTTTQHTSHKQSAYPTWSQEFIYAGVDLFDLIQGGLEVLLYDHHMFSNTLVGGVRLSIPQKAASAAETQQKRLNGQALPFLSASSQPNSRSSSPGLIDSPYNQVSPEHDTAAPMLQFHLAEDDFSGTRSTVDIITFDHDLLRSSPVSCHIRSASFGGCEPSPVSSPALSRRSVPIFTLPGYKESSLSPGLSPVLNRKQRSKSAKPSPKQLLQRKTDWLHDWMDSTGNEITHWQRILDNPGEWIYCWHLLRPKIIPANKM